MSNKIVIDAGEEVWNNLERYKLALDDLTIQDESKCGQYVLAIIGKLRVANLAFGKFVFARVTFNNWASYRDYTGAHTESSKDGKSDVFAFGFTRRDKRPVYVEFALSCIQDGQQYWDNNGGKNYCFRLGEDPFENPDPDHSGEAKIVTTWRVAEETSPDQEAGEVIFDTSSYPHFQAHPLTPTKIKCYASLNAAPEKEIIPAKVADSKHVHAFNALAIENLLIIEEKPNLTENHEVQATVVNEEEAAISLTIVETNESETQQVVTVQDQIVTEDSVEPIKVEKPIYDKPEDQIFDDIEKREAIGLDVQIIEEPGEGNEVERNGTGPLEADAANAVQNEEHPKDTDALDGKEDAKTEPTKESKKKKDKKEKKKGKKDKHEQKSESEENQEQKAASELQNGDDRSLSSKKERIDEEAPKKRKKGFLSRMACCGKAEPD